MPCVSACDVRPTHAAQQPGDGPAQRGEREDDRERDSERDQERRHELRPVLAERRQDRRIDGRTVRQERADRIFEARAFDIALGDTDHVVTAEQRSGCADLRCQQPDHGIATGGHQVLGTDVEVLDVEAVADVDQTTDRERVLRPGPHLHDLEAAGAKVALDEHRRRTRSRAAAAPCTRSAPAPAATCRESSRRERCRRARFRSSCRRAGAGAAPNRRARWTPAPRKRQAPSAAPSTPSPSGRPLRAAGAPGEGIGATPPPGGSPSPR